MFKQNSFLPMKYLVSSVAATAGLAATAGVVAIAGLAGGWTLALTATTPSPLPRGCWPSKNQSRMAGLGSLTSRLMTPREDLRRPMALA